MRHFSLCLILICLLCLLSLTACLPGAPTPPTPTRPATTATRVPPTAAPPTTAPPTAAPPSVTAPRPTASATTAATAIPPTGTATTAPTVVRSATPTAPTQAQATAATGGGSRPTATRPATASSLRGLDWETVLKTDPKLEYDPSVPTFGQPLGPYVRLRGVAPSGLIEGHGVTSKVLYGDISGDGREEAVISLYSGGTAGDVGLLIYREIDGQPVLMTGLPGYKVGATIANGELRVSQPLYGANDANCCPSGVEETAYRLQGDRLARAREPMSRGIPEMKRPVVERFYQFLAAKDYRQAYEELSPAYKAGHPYDAWAAGYQNTQSVTATATDRPNGAVGVDLTATDRTASGTVTKRYTGVWTLVWNPDKKQWLMDKGVLNEVK
ncbi:MAG: hypothetical protein KIT87_21150 [Anaerolineae bacterium]|nr:hypothetical protein [Anaerolineae bacterium]